MSLMCSVVEICMVLVTGFSKFNLSKPTFYEVHFTKNVSIYQPVAWRVHLYSRCSKEAKVLEDWHTTKAGLQCFMRAVLLLMNIASCFAAV